MSGNAIVAIVFILIVIAIVAFSGLPMIRAHFRTERIVAHGENATARVLSLRDTGTRVNGQPLTDIEVEVQPPGGAAFRSTAQAVVTAVNAPTVQPGRVLNVRFFPEDHSRVVILGAAP